MTHKKPSINDLAKKLNISKTTISFILNGKAKEKRISETLVERVKAEALKLGYIPNQFAKSLRTGKTHIIGLMVEDISNPFFATIAKYIEDKVYQNGYRIIYCSTENDKNRAKEFLDMFETLGVDGCILAPPRGLENEILEMAERGKPVVLFDRQFGSRHTDAVLVDNQGGTGQAVDHLVSRGYRDIAMVALALDKPEKEDRIVGYINAIAAHKLKSHVHALPFKNQYLDYVDGVRKIIVDGKFDAVIFGTNYLGIAGLEAINKLKLKIPKDIAMVSFDDHDLFRIHKPGITVIAQPIEEIAQTVIDTLLATLQQSVAQKRVAKMITLSTTLIPRESSARHKAD